MHEISSADNPLLLLPGMQHVQHNLLHLHLLLGICYLSDTTCYTCCKACNLINPYPIVMQPKPQACNVVILPKPHRRAT